MGVLGKQLDDAGTKFAALSTTGLTPVNDALGKAKLEPIKVISQEEWNKKQQ